MPEPFSDRQPLLDQLREANERLVLSSMQAQEWADRADASRTEAEVANRLKDEFLASVSHELRTPLSAVLGWARLLCRGQLDPVRAMNGIYAIERNAKTLARIIDDLLDMSRIIGGHVKIDPEPVNLVAVIQAAVDEVRLTAEGKGLDLKLRCRAVPGAVAGDPLRLQQVVSNLLSNAIKFTAEGGQIEVRCHAGDGCAEIQVADTGQGISPEFLPRIFDRFAQADGSTTRRQGGIGLGLAIVRALVERHGGTVAAASPGLGKGATFTVRLPVVVRDTGAASEPSPATKVTERVDGVRVLLVDDDIDGREVVAILLELAGAKVTSAASAREALNAIDVVRPHVIVSDIGMPGEDGYALIRRVREREAGHGDDAIPAIALTGYVRPEDRVRLLAAGFQAHHPKPVDPDALVATIASMMALRSHAS